MLFFVLRFLFHVHISKSLSNTHGLSDDGDTNTFLNYFSVGDIFEHIGIYTKQLLEICLQIMNKSWSYFYQCHIFE